MKPKINFLMLAALIIVGPFRAYGQPCAPVTYFDDFSNPSTSVNFDYRNNFSGTGTAAGTGYQITGGVLETNGGTGSNGGFAVVNNNGFPTAVTDYTIDADIEMDSFNWQGVYGIAFRANTNGDSYTFQLNGYSGATPNWQVEKNQGGWSYLATGATAPVYTAGTTIHMKVIVTGNNFQCFLNMNTGAGLQLIYNVTDTSTPLTVGGLGIRTYGIANTNMVRIDNFTVTSCSTSLPPTPTPTPTSTPTTTPTATPAGSPTNTPTPVVDCSPNMRLSLNCMSPATGPVTITVSACQYSIEIYNTAGELIKNLAVFTSTLPALQTYSWDGSNNTGDKVASGVYVFHLKSPMAVSTQKLVVIH